MKTLKKILLTAGALAVIIISFLLYMGFFASAKIEEKEEGGYIVVGMNFTGPYSKAGQYIGGVDTKLKALGIVSTKGFGIYYDDPKTTPPEKCRSFVGNILDKKKIAEIKDIQSHGLKIDSIPKAKSVVIEFPIKNMISFMIGPMKIYPVLTKYMKEKKYKPVLSFEVYDNTEKKIIFVMQYTSESI